MRLTSCILLAITALVVVAADDFKPEPGFKLLFNGKNLDGWQTKATGKDGKPIPLEGKTEAFDGRFKVKDGELVYDPKVKGDRYIETVLPVSGDFTIRFDFKPGDGCNNDLLFLGAKFDILAGGKTTLKGVKLDEWNKMEIVAKGGNVDYLINGEKVGSRKTKEDKGPFILRAEFGPMVVKNLRMSDGK
jgi:3-keto-disaccharide hydrolase